jgi:hypothetical protein
MRLSSMHTLLEESENDVKIESAKFFLDNDFTESH